MVNICPENRRHETANQLRFASGSLETLKRIIEQDYGYTLLPELAILDLPAARRKYLKELVQPAPVREVSLVVHRGLLKQNLIRALQAHILAAIPEPLKDKQRGRIVTWR